MMQLDTFDHGLIPAASLGEFEFVKLASMGRRMSKADIKRTLREAGVTSKKKIRAGVRHILKDMDSAEHWASSVYHVAVYKNERHGFGDGEMWHLSIKRHDKEPMQDWRVLQNIKTAICGAEVEAIELYPAESRVVDTANQYHLYAFMDESLTIPCGFMTGLRMDSQIGGAKQREGSAREEIA
jgi:hypothetical protein